MTFEEYLFAPNIQHMRSPLGGMQGAAMSEWPSLIQHLFHLPTTHHESPTMQVWHEFIESFEGLVASIGDLGWMMALAGNAWVVKAIVDHGTEAQRRQLLPRLQAGAITATALAEPHTGTDMQAIQTRLRRENHGWLLYGEKKNISMGQFAEFILVLAKADGVDGPAYRLAFLDAQRHPWVAKPTLEKIGLESLPTANLQFPEIMVEEADLLQSPMEGLPLLGTIMTFGRCLIGLGTAAILEPLLMETVAFAERRISAGRPISHQQMIQCKLSEAKLKVMQTRTLSKFAMEACLANEPQAVGMGSLAKLSASRTLLEVSQILLSIHGTEGYYDSAIGRLAKDSLAFLMVGGTEEIHHLNVFKQMQRGLL